MRTINEYKNRFNQLLESTIGDVKPLVNEQETKGFCLKKWKDTTKQQYKNCMFEGVTSSNIGNFIMGRYNLQEHIYSDANSPNYNSFNKFYFYDSSKKQVMMRLTSVFEIGGVPILLSLSTGLNPKVKTIMDYMVANQFLKSSDITDSTKITHALGLLPTNKPNIAKKENGGIVVSMPAPEKVGELAPITNFTFWPSKANIYYYDENNVNFMFSDEGAVDSTFLTLIQNRI